MLSHQTPIEVSSIWIKRVRSSSLNLANILMKKEDVNIEAKSLFTQSTIIVLLFIAVGLSGCSRLSVPQGWAGFVQHENIIVSVSMDGQIIALNKDSGRHKWDPVLLRVEEKNENRRAVYGTPVLDNGIIIVGSYDGKLHAVSIDDGRLVETEPVTEEFVAGPVYHNGVVYIGGSDGNMYAYRVENMSGGTVSFELEWKRELGSKIWSTAVVYQDILIFGSLDHNVYGLDVNNGDTIWTYETGGAIASSPLVEGGTAYIGSFDSTFYAIYAESGKEKWRFTESSNWYWATPIIFEGYVYAASLDGKVYSLDAVTGDKKWESVSDGPIVGTPVIVRDMIIFGSTDGKIYVSDLYSGNVLNTCDIGETVETPLLSIGDDIYFGARDFSTRSLNIKSNGNPDENWDAPYFSDKAKEGKNPQPSDWAPDC